MGKIDDIRRQREQQFAEQQRASHVRKDAAKGDKAGSAAKATEPTTVLDSTVDKIALPQTAPPAAKAAKTSKIANAPSKAAGRGKSATDVAEAKCPVCGKLRAVKNGVMAEHQKGLGKHCAGSRQKPA